eukprot:1298514-Pleurochrysis_carterae.AAC.1
MYLSSAEVVAWLQIPAGAAPGCGWAGDASGSVPDRWSYRDAYLSWMLCRAASNCGAKRRTNLAPCVPSHGSQSKRFEVS